MDEQTQGKSITIRFPGDVLEGLRHLAARHERSFNGEVVWALREYMERQPKPDAPEGRQSNDHNQR